jgi:hypothetical protein
MTVHTFSRRLGVNLVGFAWVGAAAAMVAAFALAFFVALGSLNKLLY